MYLAFSFFLYIMPDLLSSISAGVLCTLRVQDKNLQVTISKLPYDSFTCTLGDSPCTGDILLTSRSEGRCTYLVSSLQMPLENACSDTEIFLAASEDRSLDLY